MKSYPMKSYEILWNPILLNPMKSYEILSYEILWNPILWNPMKSYAMKSYEMWLFSGQISLEIDQFCADQTSFFNVFLREVIICSFNNNTLQKWTNGKAFNIMASAQFFAT